MRWRGLGTQPSVRTAAAAPSCFDPLASEATKAVRFGTTGRNILRGPGVLHLDASLFRKFWITKRFGRLVRMERFGVTNTSQFGNPGANVSNL